MQHIYHKSGYNYTKRTSAMHMVEIMGGPGIVVALGTPLRGRLSRVS